MPKKEMLQMCEILIRKDLGSLNDLPHELANTVANVYYRYINMTVDLARQKANNPNGFVIPTQVKRETDIVSGFSSFIKDLARFKSDYEVTAKAIKELRMIDKRKDPNLYQFTVDFILDCLKYSIENAQKKSGLRRMIERKFSNAKEREIPKLIDLLDI